MQLVPFGTSDETICEDVMHDGAMKNENEVKRLCFVEPSSLTYLHLTQELEDQHAKAR